MEHDLEQIDATLQLLTDAKSEDLLNVTYSRFFQVCPKAETLWEKDDPVSRGKMFNGVILTIFDNISRPKIGEDNLVSDVKDHDGYGVSKEMYQQFFDSLVGALEEVLGEAFTVEMSTAWRGQLTKIKTLIHKHTEK